MLFQRSIVPCGDCKLCCKMMTPLHPDKGDVIKSYDYAFLLRDGKMMPILNRKDNGDCVYLGEHGCTIHDRAPYACQRFDCREEFKNSNRAGRKIAIKNKVMPKAIFDRGRELLGL